MVRRGPRKAPRLSPKPSSPNAFPLYCGSTHSATIASLGAARLPALDRSATLAKQDPVHMWAIPINGFEMADII